MSQTHLPSHWHEATLKDCCQKPEYGFTASATNKPAGPKFLRITDIQDSGVQWETVPYCEVTEEVKKSHLLKPGDIVVARIGATTGKAYFVKDCPDTVLASYLIRLRAKPELLPEFLGFYCQTEAYWKHIDQNKGGRLKGGVNIPVLQSLAIPLPPFSEQQAIARVLRSVQKAKEIRRKQLQLERELKAALMQRLFTRGARGEARKQTEIGEMPESWQVVRLGEVAAQTQYGLSLRGGSSGSFPILRMNNLGNGVIDLSDLQYVEVDAKTLQSFRLNKGDLLFNRTNSYELVGKTSLFDCDGDFVFASYLVRVVVDADKANPAFLNEYLNASATQGRLKMLASRGVSQTNISASKLRGFAVPLPSVSEQDEIAKILEACGKVIALLEKESALLDELFRALLEELMTGRLSATALIESQ
jgi:type I restriction enzyme S subunit